MKILKKEKILHSIKSLLIMYHVELASRLLTLMFFFQLILLFILDFCFQSLRNNRLLTRLFFNIFIILIIIKILLHLLQINIQFILIFNYAIFVYHLSFWLNLGVEYLFQKDIINITLLLIFARIEFFNLIFNICQILF